MLKVEMIDVTDYFSTLLGPCREEVMARKLSSKDDKRRLSGCALNPDEIDRWCERIKRFLMDRGSPCPWREACDALGMLADKTIRDSVLAAFLELEGVRSGDAGLRGSMVGLEYMPAAQSLRPKAKEVSDEDIIAAVREYGPAGVLAEELATAFGHSDLGVRLRRLDGAGLHRLKVPNSRKNRYSCWPASSPEPEEPSGLT